MDATVLSDCACYARVDEVCDRFESAWKAGSCPSVEQYLERCDVGSARAKLLFELLYLEIHYRRRHGEVVQAAELQQRFPEAASEVEHLCTKQPSTSQEPPDVSRSTVMEDRFTRHTTRMGVASHSTDSHARSANTVPGVATSLGAAEQRATMLLGDVALPCPKGYALIEQLGRGGMGIVVKARQIRADRHVALKFIRPDGFELLDTAGRHQILERFRAEIRAVAKLEHENIVRVYEVGDVEGVPFFSMQYVDGESLSTKSKRQALDDRDAAKCIERIARAVHVAHRCGILHRDIKPQNILLEKDTGRPLLLDFGLAKFLGGDGSMTAEGDLMGSPSYASPEQLRSPAHVDERADIYSLGATLYHALTGSPPFEARTLPEIIQQVSTVEPVAPRRLNPAVDRDLETICLKCLEKDPQRRFATAKQVADELHRYVHGEPIGAGRVGLFGHFRRMCVRRPAIACLSMAVALLVAALIGVSATSYVRISRALERESIQNRRIEAERTAALEARIHEHALRLVAEARATRVEQKVKLIQQVLRHFLACTDIKPLESDSVANVPRNDPGDGPIEVPLVLDPKPPVDRVLAVTPQVPAPSARPATDPHGPPVDCAVTLGQRFALHVSEGQFGRARHDLLELGQIMQQISSRGSSKIPAPVLMLREAGRDSE